MHLFSVSIIRDLGYFVHLPNILVKLTVELLINLNQQ